MLVFVLLTNARGQTNFASVTGQIVDAKQAAMSRVAMVLKSSDTGLTRRTFSDAQGFYQFTAVNPGNYELQAERPGFAKEVRNLVLTVNQALRVDITLQIGTNTQVVNVNATPPPLRTSDATLGELIDSFLERLLTATIPKTSLSTATPLPYWLLTIWRIPPAVGMTQGGWMCEGSFAAA